MIFKHRFSVRIGTLSMKEVNTERRYARVETAGKLHRIADAIAEGKPFRVQINGHRVTVPGDALFEIELEQDDGKGEVEIELRWDRRRSGKTSGNRNQ